MNLGSSTIETWALWVLAGLIFLALRNRPLSNPEWEDFYFFVMRIFCVSSFTAAIGTRVFDAFYSPLIFFFTVILSGITFIYVADRIGPIASYMLIVQEKQKINVFVKGLLLYLSRKDNPERSLVLMAVVLSAIVSSVLVMSAAKVVAFLW